MPIGKTAMPNPWRTLATMRTGKASVIPPNNDPKIMTEMVMINIFRLPNMSANFETDGVATTLVINVAVMSHEASSTGIPKIDGKSGINGIIMNCIQATAPAPVQSVAITTQLGHRGTTLGPSSEVDGVVKSSPLHPTCACGFFSETLVALTHP